jgi:sirohydrochlorin cobaltochelatase
MTQPVASGPASTHRGLLLFCHGARDPNWALPFEAVAAAARQHEPQVPVALAFLEFMTPDLVVAGQQLVSQGCQQVDVVPLFLGAGGHVRKDLPLLMQTLREQHPHTSFRLHPAVGEHPDLVAAMARIALAHAAAPALAPAAPTTRP